jgi:hypothetical protein
VEKIVALFIIAFAITLILGETLRQYLFPEGDRKQQICYDPFIFLKLKTDFPPPILLLAPSAFSQIICPVRNHV